MDESTIADCFTRFPDQWVCVDATAEDEAGQTQRGRVIGHGPDKKAALQIELRFRKQHPERTTHMFFAGPLVNPGANVVAIL